MSARTRHKEHPVDPPPRAPVEAAAPTPLMPEDIRARVTELKTKAAELLRQQFKLAEDLDTEPAYLATVAEAAETHAEIDRLTSLLVPLAPKEASPPAPAAAAAPAPIMPAAASPEPASEPLAAPPPGLTDHLRQQIEDLKRQAADLQERKHQLAEQSINDPAAIDDYNATVTEIATCAADIDRLTTAAASIEARAVSEAAAVRQADAAALRARVTDMLLESIDAARAFETSLGAAVQAFRSLIEIRERAWNAWPGPQPIGLSLVGGEIIKRIAAEMYRQNPSPPLTGGALRRAAPALPAPKCPRLELLDLPEKIPSLVAELQQANAAAKRFLEGGK